MIKVFRKNQIVFLMLGVILVTAGYLNYTYTPEVKYKTELTGNIDDTLGDTIYVNAFTDDNAIETTAKPIQPDEIEEDKKQDVKKDTYFAQTKIQRDNMLQQQIDTYKEILESENIGSEQKMNAQSKIEEITKLKNSIMIAENLILIKDIEDVVIMTSGKNVNVVIKNEKELEKEKVAQIYSIVNKELEADINNIQIMLKK